MTSSVRDACVPAFQRGVGRRVDECGRRCARDDDGMGWDGMGKKGKRCATGRLVFVREWL